MTTPTTEQTNIPVDNEPTAEQSTTGDKAKQTWMEEIEVAGGQLVEQVKEWINEGNVRRLIIRSQDNKVLIEIPLTAGVAVGGVVTLFAPVLAAIGALAALIAKVKIQIVRAEEPPQA
ncbi:MAG: DUF4342 domain-containing protein [Caldilineaceae bacterium]|nr:DUF4342 domain-containing protein [Caldilineaceae bacterium]